MFDRRIGNDDYDNREDDEADESGGSGDELAMLFRRLPPRVVGSLTSALSDIKVGRISPADACAR